MAHAIATVHDQMIVDYDDHFVINPITRKIEPATPTKNLLVQGDHNSERYTFEVPRRVEGHDESQTDRIMIHFANVGKSGDIIEDVYEVDDSKIIQNENEQDMVVFSWLVSRNACTYEGTLTFGIEFSCFDEDDSEVYSWNTEIYTSIVVRKGMSNEASVIDSFSDILESWRRELFYSPINLKDQILKELVRKGEDVINSIPESYFTFIEKQNEKLSHLIEVSEEQPESEDNRIWVTPTGDSVTLLEESDIDNTLTIAGKVADAKATGDRINGVKRDLEETKSQLSESIVEIQDELSDFRRIKKSNLTWELGGYNLNTGEKGLSKYLIRTDKKEIPKECSLEFTGLSKDPQGVSMSKYAFFWDADGEYIGRDGSIPYVIPNGAKYVAFTYGYLASTEKTISSSGGVDIVSSWWDISCDLGFEIELYNIDQRVTALEDGSNKKTGLFTFIDDDGYSEQVAHWLEVSKATGIKITECVVTEWVGQEAQAPTAPYLKGLTWDEIRGYQGTGFEFVSHSHSHANFGVTDAWSIPDLISDVEESQRLLSEHGCNTEFLVYPGGHHDDSDGGIVDSVVRTHFKGAVAISDVGNQDPLYTYSIFRYSLVDKTGGKVSVVDSNGNTRQCYPIHDFDWFKNLIDDAIANDKWVVFMSHLYNYGNYYYNDDIKTRIVEVAKYIASQGGQIMRLSDAFEVRKNRFESAPRSKSVSYIVDRNGKVFDKH